MRLPDILRFALKALASRKRRTALTMLGILVGVLTLTAVVSVAHGYSKAVVSVINISSPRLILVRSRASPLDDSDLLRLESVPGVERAVPLITFPVQVRVGPDTRTVTVVGVDPAYVQDIFPGLELSSGAWPAPGEQAVILGNSIASSYFGTAEGVEGVTLRGEAFGRRFSARVAGVAAPYGTSILADVDSSALMPIEAAKRLLEDVSGLRGYGAAAVIAEDESAVDTVLQFIRLELGDQVDYVAMRDIQGALDQAVRMAVLVLGGVASMTLVVAAIGIMNAMFTAVTERTRIIGVMRAMGASRSDVALSFLAEGAVMALIAGALGIALGYLTGGALMAAIAGGGATGPRGAALELSVSLPAEYAAGIFLVTLAITVVGAVPPALRAASLEPSEALRYE